MIRTKINSLRKDNFIRNNVIFFVGSMAGAFLSYLYHPILGRMMKVEDFGEVQSLLSLSAQMGIFLGIFGTISVNLVANSEEDKQKLDILSRLYRLAFWITVFSSLLMVVFATQLKQFFHFTSFYPFILLSISLIISNPFTFLRAYLQGKNRFKAVSWAGIIGSAGRLVFAVILVFLGFAVFGVIVALVLSNLLALAFVYTKTKKHFRLKRTREKQDLGVLWPELKFGLLIFFATGFVTFLSTTDVLFVKHYFPPEEAGFYSGISTIARIIAFVTGSVSAVMLPAIKIKNSFQKNSQILKKAFWIVALIGGGAFLTFLLFPAMVINLLIGSRYEAFAHLLPKLSFVFFLVSLVNLMFIYFLALRKYFLIYISTAGITIVFLLCAFSHQNVEGIINNFLIGTSLTLGLITFFYIHYHFQNNGNSIGETETDQLESEETSKKTTEHHHSSLQ